MTKVRVYISGAILLPAVLLLAGCANTPEQGQGLEKHPAAGKGQAGKPQTALQNLIKSNIVRAVSSNALAKHDNVDYVSAALNGLQKTYSLDLSDLMKQLTPNNADYSFYRGVYIAYSKRNDIEPEEINRTAIESMLKLVDSRSRYYDAASYQEIKNSLGRKGVIGAVLSRDKQGIRLVQVLEGGPAEKAGLPVGGHIIAINNKEIAQKPLSDANILLRGTPGSTLDINIQDPQGVTHSYKLQRAVLKVNNVSVKKLKHKILYIRIGYFDIATRKQILNEAARLNFKPSGVILDLRLCSGGIMKSVVGVGDLFLSSGDFLKIKNTNPLFETEFKTTSGDPLENVRNVALLVSGATASGAEGMAMALRHRAKARIIGSRTAGRNVIQSIYPLRDGSAIKLTTGRLELADGQSWGGHGVRPDVCINYARNVLVKNTRHGCGVSYYTSKSATGRDIALDQAIHYLTSHR